MRAYLYPIWTVNYLALRRTYVSWGKHGRHDPARWYLAPTSRATGASSSPSARRSGAQC